MEGIEHTTYMENLCSCIQNSYRLRTGDFEGFIMIFWNTSIKNKNLVMSIQTHMIFFSGTQNFAELGRRCQSSKQKRSNELSLTSVTIGHVFNVKQKYCT